MGAREAFARNSRTAAGSTVRLVKAVNNAVPDRYPLPEPLEIDDGDRFLHQADVTYPLHGRDPVRCPSSQRGQARERRSGTHVTCRS